MIWTSIKSCVGILRRASSVCRLVIDFRSQVAVRSFVLRLLDILTSLLRTSRMSWVPVSAIVLWEFGSIFCVTRWTGLSLMDNETKFGCQLTPDLWEETFWPIHMTDSAKDFDGRQSAGNDPRFVPRHWVVLVLCDTVIFWDDCCIRGHEYKCDKTVVFLDNVISDQISTTYTSVKVLEQFTLSNCNPFHMCGRVLYQRNITQKRMCVVRRVFCVPFVSACSAVADSTILLRFFTKRITCFNAYASRSASLHRNPSFPSDTWWTVLSSNSVLLLPVTVCAVLLLISRWLLLPSSSFPWAALSSRQLSLLLDTARPTGVQLLLHGRVARTDINTSSLVFPYLPVALNSPWLHALFSSWTYRQCVRCMTTTASFTTFTTWRISILLLAWARPCRF